jgi:hypothetical protein
VADVADQLSDAQVGERGRPTPVQCADGVPSIDQLGTDRLAEKATATRYQYPHGLTFLELVLVGAAGRHLPVGPGTVRSGWLRRSRR